MRVLHHLDDALSAIRQALLDRPHPVLVKIVNETGHEELHVFRINAVDAAEPEDLTAGEKETPHRLHQRGTPPSPQPTVSTSLLSLRSSRIDVQQELGEQRQRIVELESALLLAREGLRRTLNGGVDDRPHDAGGADGSGHPQGVSSPSASLSAEEDGTSEAGVSDIEEGVSLLLQAVDSSSVGDAAASHDVASTTSDDSDSADGRSASSSRKSNRQRKPVERLDNRPTLSPPLNTKRKSAESFASEPRPRPAQKIQRLNHTSSSSHCQHATVESDADDEEVEVSTLVGQLKEAYEHRATVSIDAVSSHTLLQMTQGALSYNGTEEPQQSTLQQCAVQITSLINTSSTLRMLGYYLRAALVHRLKQASSRNYSRLARDVLDIRSSADIAVYPAFFELIRKHCPTIAAAAASGGAVCATTIEEWLREPLFMADIGWRSWRRYLSKQHHHILEEAVQRFSVSIEPYKDWLQLGWVEIYDDEQLGGEGIRALRDIHMPSGAGKKKQQDLAASVSVVAADLHCAGPEYIRSKQHAREDDGIYHIQLDRQRVFDARHHWVGKLNHLPMPQCNLRLTGNGKLVQIKPIQAGDAVTLDYGVDYWVYRITGLDVRVWMAEGEIECQRGRMALFTRMHQTVSDYTDLLRQKWTRSLSSSSSAVEREGLLVELEEHLDAMSAIDNDP